MALVPEVKKQWVEALRSGQYLQCRNRLHNDAGGYCCLGVLGCVIGAVRDENYGTRLSYKDREFTVNDIPLKHYQLSTFVKFNDTEQKSFAEIADAIESDPSLTA